jgi:hypothetical protein
MTIFRISGEEILWRWIAGWSSAIGTAPFFASDVAQFLTLAGFWLAVEVFVLPERE